MRKMRSCCNWGLSALVAVETRVPILFARRESYEPQQLGGCHPHSTTERSGACPAKLHKQQALLIYVQCRYRVSCRDAFIAKVAGLVLFLRNPGGQERLGFQYGLRRTNDQ